MFNGGESITWTECATCGEGLHPQFPDCFCVLQARANAGNAGMSTPSVVKSEAVNSAPVSAASPLRFCLGGPDIERLAERPMSKRPLHSRIPVRVVCMATLPSRVFRGLVSNRRYWWVRERDAWIDGFVHGNTHLANVSFDQVLLLKPGVAYTLGCGTFDNGIRKHFSVPEVDESRPDDRGADVVCV